MDFDWVTLISGLATAVIGIFSVVYVFRSRSALNEAEPEIADANSQLNVAAWLSILTVVFIFITTVLGVYRGRRIEGFNKAFTPQQQQKRL